jgi:PAS domain S-box-containing protein
MPKTSKTGVNNTTSGNKPSASQIAKVSTRFKRLDELLNKATNLARIGVWEIDAIRGAIYWSDITKDIHEAEPCFEPDMATAINFYKEGDDRATIVQKMEDAIKNCAPFDVELQIVTAKGNTKWIRVIAEGELENGKCSRVYGSIQDINARKNAEIAEMHALEERNTILESIGDAFFAVDKNWTVTYWNHVAEKVLGRPKNEILDHNLWEVYSDSIESESYKKYHQAIETKRVVRFEDYYPPLDRWYEISAFPSDNGLSVYFKDITERLNYIKAIEEQNENLKEISWLQSHVIRAPLARIMGLIHLIKDPNQDGSEKRKTLDYLLLSANELDEVIKTITEKSHQPGKPPGNQTKPGQE